MLANAGTKALPLFNKVPNVRFTGRAAYTNLPVGGAYRGYGATQGAFAFGEIVDRWPQRGDRPGGVLPPWHIREGKTSPVFAALGEGREGVPRSIDRAGSGVPRAGGAAFGWSGRRERTRPGGRGTGPAGARGGHDLPDAGLVHPRRSTWAAASIKMNEDGSFTSLVGATDLGTGSDTVLAQIAAEVLGVPPERIIVYSSDTDLTPFDVGAYASSTTYLSGEAVREAPRWRGGKY